MSSTVTASPGPTKRASDRIQFLIVGLLFLILPWLFFVLPWRVNVQRLLLSQFSSDAIIEHYPDRIFSARVYAAGAIPLWNGDIESGVPHAAAVQSGAFYLPNIVLYLAFPPVLAFNLSLLLHFSFAGVVTYVYLRGLNQPRVAASLGGFVFMFSGFLVVLKGNVPLFNSAVWIPALFLCFEKWRTSRKLKYSILGGGVLGMQVLAGWPQLALLSSIYLFVFVALSLAAESKKRQFVSGVLLLLAFAVGVSMVQTLPTLEFKAQTNLQAIPYSHFLENSFSPGLLGLFLFPNFLGAGSLHLYRMTYWGPPDLATNSAYVGILPLLLACLALGQLKASRAVRNSVVVAVISLCLAMGGYTPLAKIMYHVPLYNFFRDHFVNLIFLDFALCVLAAHGASWLISRSSKVPLQPVLWTCAGLLAAAFSFLLSARYLLMRLDPALSPLPPDWRTKFAENFHWTNPALFLPAAIMLGSIVVLLAWIRFPASNGLRIVVFLTLGLDLFSFAGFAEALPTEGLPSPQDAAIEGVMDHTARAQPFRVLSLTREHVFLASNLNVWWPYQELLGYGPFLPNEYADLIGLNTGGGTKSGRELLVNNRILSLLNTMFVFLPSRVGIPISSSGKRESFINSSAPVKIPEGIVTSSQWHSFGTVDFADGSYKLTAAPARAAGILAGIQQDVSLKPNSAYIFGFETRSDGPSSGLLADVAGTEYDQGSLPAWIIPRSFTPYRRLVLSGSQAASVTLKIYTDSENPIFVRNVFLRELGQLPRLSDDYYARAALDQTLLLQNRRSSPRAFFVSRIRPVRNYLEARSILWDISEPFDPTTEALVENLPQLEVGPVDKGEVSSLQYAPNMVQISARCTGKCFLILADSFFPGWVATCDGRPVPIYRTDGVLRGVMLGQGEHAIEFNYRPRFFKLGFFTSLASGLMILISAFWPGRKAA